LISLQTEYDTYKSQVVQEILSLKDLLKKYSSQIDEQQEAIGGNLVQLTDGQKIIQEQELQISKLSMKVDL